MVFLESFLNIYFISQCKILSTYLIGLLWQNSILGLPFSDFFLQWPRTLFIIVMAQFLFKYLWVKFRRNLFFRMNIHFYEIIFFMYNRSYKWTKLLILLLTNSGVKRNVLTQQKKWMGGGYFISLSCVHFMGPVFWIYLIAFWFFWWSDELKQSLKIRKLGVFMIKKTLYSYHMRVHYYLAKIK